MESDLHSRAVRDIEAALSGLASSLQGESVRPELLLTPLARIGDALRLGIEVPTQLRRWIERVPESALREALSALLAEMEMWRLPVRGDGHGDNDHSLAFAIRRRDESESVKVAVRRILLPKGGQPEELTEFAALEAAHTLRDSSFAELLTRSDVLRLLGTRAALKAEWADAFRDDEEVDEVDRSATDEAWPKAVHDSVPSDEVVARYVARGALNRLVEKVASTNERFASELALFIDTMLAAREDVGLVARRWRKRSQIVAGIDPLRFSVIPAARLAAASKAQGEAAKTTVRLGTLTPTGAVGHMEVGARELTLQIYPGAKALDRIELGNTIATSAVDADHWELTVPLPTSSLRLRVVAADGGEFVEDLTFGSVDTDEAH